MITNGAKRLIVVLGMHRSGTSAITRGLEAIGVDLGGNTHEAMPNVNEKGFFEDNDIVEINEEILKTLSCEWHTLILITREKLLDESLSDIKLKAINTLREKTCLNNIFAMKDPRMARLLPFWQDVFEKLNLIVSYVISIRNPLSVVQSLYKRDQIESEKACYLWLQHVVPSILQTSGCNRVVVDYDHMLDQSEIELGRIISALMSNASMDVDECEIYKNKFLDSGLRHTKFDIHALKENQAIPKHVICVYEELTKVAEDKQTIEAEDVQSCLRKASVHLMELDSAFNYMSRQDWKISALKNEIIDGRKETDSLISEYQCKQKELKLHSSVLQNENDSLHHVNDDLHNEINAIYSTISWKVTVPLRKMSWALQRIIRLFKFYRNYRQKHAGLRGFIRLIDQSVRALRKGGITGLIQSISSHEKELLSIKKAHIDLPVFLDDNHESSGLPSDVAVHTHIYYPEMAPKIKSYLENIPVEFHCYVTTDSMVKAKEIEKVFSDIKKIRKLYVHVVKNKGRDLAPMIISLGEELAHHELVLHIHSKRSPHNPDLSGWGRYLMEVLLGNPNRVTSIFNFFKQNKHLGIFSPYVYFPVIPFMRLGGNVNHIAALLKRSGLDNPEAKNIDPVNFPAGSMFWFRGKVIEPFIRMKLSLDDFENEAGQCDGTLAHAIERLFPYFSNNTGLDFRSYLPMQFAGSELGTAPLSAFDSYSRDGLLGSPVIIFDHNIGGGTNRYSRELINSILAEDTSVLRIYITGESWIVEWIGADDGMIFSDSCIDSLFNSLGKTSCRDIVVNSLYAYPDVDDAISRIIKLGQQLNVSLDYKVHDFYPVCPSQHLIDYRENYCFVPQNHDQCMTCLKNNPAVHWASNKEVDIDEWRKPFTRLFEMANVISIFDDSTIEILRKAFKLDDSKVGIFPHSDSYFSSNQPMIVSKMIHVAVLGTLTTVKGAEIVNSLGMYMAQQNYKAKLTVIGSSYVPVSSGIEVLGSYENKNLSDIIYDQKVNVILMPTIVPETFSYTISEAIKMGLPIIAFDIGAQGNRVKQYEFGEVVPLGSSSEVIFSAIQAAHNKMLELNK